MASSRIRYGVSEGALWDCHQAGQGSVDMRHGEGNNTTVSHDLKLVSNLLDFSE